MIERHITLDRAMWGSDQAASVEWQGFWRLVKDVRAIERSMGDGIKRVYPSEVPIMTLTVGPLKPLSTVTLIDRVPVPDDRPVTDAYAVAGRSTWSRPVDAASDVSWTVAAPSTYRVPSSRPTSSPRLA